MTTAEQVRAFRARATFLDARLPAGSLLQPAFAGLQDSSPRSAVLSLHARVENVRPDDWEDPAFVQVWGPRRAIYLVREEDAAAFTIGAGRDGGTRIRWDARTTESWSVPEPDIDPAVARAELARRYLRSAGPATLEGFTWWSGTDPDDAEATWRSLAGELVRVDVEGRETFLLAGDEAALGGAEPVTGVRLLPPGDPYLAGFDRDLLLPDPYERKAVWPPNQVWPGALFLDGEIAGTWRRRQRRVTVTPFWPLPDRVVDALEQEVATMPVEGRPSVEISDRG